MFRRLRDWLRNASQIHVRDAPAQTLSELVSLFDRFLDGPLAYPLEWDDFISWKHPNPNFEAIRDRICEHERLLFSRERGDREAYAAIVAAERDKAAALCGLAPRGARTHVNRAQ